MTAEKRLERLRRDIGTVLEIAQRRSDPDRDHMQMMNRLAEWQNELSDALAALRTQESNQ